MAMDVHGWDFGLVESLADITLNYPRNKNQGKDGNSHRYPTVARVHRRGFLHGNPDQIDPSPESRPAAHKD